MTVIEKLQKACENANRIQAEADELGFSDGVCPLSQISHQQQHARALSKHASEQAYAFSQAILLQQPQTERDAVILLIHLVQQTALIAADYWNPQTQLARRAAQAMLDWNLKRVETDDLYGWALEAITDTRSQIAA